MADHHEDTQRDQGGGAGNGKGGGENLHDAPEPPATWLADWLVGRVRLAFLGDVNAWFGQLDRIGDLGVRVGDLSLGVPDDIDVAQLQDTDAGAEVIHMADTGLCAEGEQEKLIADGRPRSAGRCPSTPTAA